MRVLSLFDGMACGMLALQKAGFEVERYVAYEIDKYAVQTSSHNFPMIEHRGDVFKANFTEFLGFDAVIGGSPCTKWSNARTAGRETTPEGIGWELYMQFVRAVNEVKPKWFIYENNKSMSKEIRKTISETFGFEPDCINSGLVSAQNRMRLYWVGKRNENGTYSKVTIDRPVDRGVVISDILDVPFSARLIMDKPFRIVSEKNSGVVALLEIKAPDTVKRVYGINGKAPTLTTCGGGHREPKILQGGLVRKLSVDECKKLQTVPVRYEFPVSNSQAYKMLGNGWTVDVIAHLLAYIPREALV